MFERSVARGEIARGMEGHQKGDESGGFRGAEIFPIGGHVTTALNHLPNELILRETESDFIEGRATLPSLAAKRLAVAALLELKDKRALALESRGVFQKTIGHGIAAPGIHLRAPGSVTREVCERAEGDSDQENAEDSDGTTTPVFFTFAKKEWKEEESDDDHNRADQERGRFERGGKQGEHGVEPEKEIIGAGSGLNKGGIGAPTGAKGAEIESARSDGQKNDSGKDKILPDGIRDKRHAILLEKFFVFGGISGAADDAAGHRPLIDAQLEDHQKMEADEGDEQAWDKENVQGEKAGERGPGDDGPTEHEFHGERADDRYTAGDRGADADAPVGVLIEAQDLTAEGHTKRHEKKEDANDPGEFAGEFVRTKEKDLHHVKKDDGDHEVGAPAVKRTKEPAQGHIVIENLQRIPGFGGRGDIDEGEQDSGKKLKNKNGEGRAAEDVKPTGGFARDVMPGSFADCGAKLDAAINPFADLRDHAHGGRSSPREAIGSPGVGSSPARIVIKPFSTL